MEKLDLLHESVFGEAFAVGDKVITLDGKGVVKSITHQKGETGEVLVNMGKYIKPYRVSTVKKESLSPIDALHESVMSEGLLFKGNTVDTPDGDGTFVKYEGNMVVCKVDGKEKSFEKSKVSKV